MGPSLLHGTFLRCASCVQRRRITPPNYTAENGRSPRFCARLIAFESLR